MNLTKKIYIKYSCIVLLKKLICFRPICRVAVAKAVVMELFKDRQPVPPYRRLVSGKHLLIWIYLFVDSILSDIERLVTSKKWRIYIRMVRISFKSSRAKFCGIIVPCGIVDHMYLVPKVLMIPMAGDISSSLTV